jgi:hypothetical protein
MSTNCLVTKLKGSVDNDNLSKIGEIKITIAPDDTIAECLALLPSSTDPSYSYARIVGDANFLDSNGGIIGKSLTYGDVISGGISESKMRISPSESEVILFVNVRYNAISFTGSIDKSNRMSMEIDEFEYNSNSFDYFTLTNYFGTQGISASGDVSKLKLTIGRSPNLLILACPNLYGSINDLLERSSSYIEKFSTYNSKIRIDLSSISWGSLTSLRELYIGGETYGDFAAFSNIPSLSTIYATHGDVMTHLTGSIEGFVENAKTRGAGSVKLPWPQNLIEVTYRGVKLPAATGTEGGPIKSLNNTFNWDAQGNITWTES